MMTWFCGVTVIQRPFPTSTDVAKTVAYSLYIGLRWTVVTVSKPMVAWYSFITRMKQLFGDDRLLKPGGACCALMKMPDGD